MVNKTLYVILVLQKKPDQVLEGVKSSHLTSRGGPTLRGTGSPDPNLFLKSTRNGI
ncbi:hypothetical protein HanIR_Chr07g0337571 [Helianthus annuus]|nr:hypothetical protein HanIR_Chr07g0337571 [Helianthus annuus]